MAGEALKALLAALALIVASAVGAPVSGFHFVPGAALDTTRISWMNGDSMNEPHPGQALAVFEASTVVERSAQTQED